MPNRSQDWLRQAEHDLDLAQLATKSGHHEWACFAAHQAAEKAVKALHQHHVQEVWGHDLVRLLEALPPEMLVPPPLVEQARVLDNFYIPTRYPDSHPQVAPFEHYGPLHSEEALRYAGEIIRFIRAALAQT